MHHSERSRSQFQPRFPRIKRLMKRRQDEEDFTTYVDDQFMVHVRPKQPRLH